MDTCQYANACTPHHTLPFTGADAALVVFLGAVLVIVGVIIHMAHE